MPIPFFPPATRTIEGQSPNITEDDFGDEIITWGPTFVVNTIGWESPRQVTYPDGSVLTIDWDITAYVQSHQFAIGDKAIIEGKEFLVKSIANYDHGPTTWLVPGFEEVHLKEVEG